MDLRGAAGARARAKGVRSPQQMCSRHRQAGARAWCMTRECSDSCTCAVITASANAGGARRSAQAPSMHARTRAERGGALMAWPMAGSSICTPVVTPCCAMTSASTPHPTYRMPLDWCCWSWCVLRRRKRNAARRVSCAVARAAAGARKRASAPAGCAEKTTVVRSRDLSEENAAEHAHQPALQPLQRQLLRRAAEMERGGGGANPHGSRNEMAFDSDATMQQRGPRQMRARALASSW
jgi:hypothetical protein